MSITDPKGFVAAGGAAGIQASGRPDLALVVNQGPRFDAAAVFTSNRVFAAPVEWSRQAVSNGRLRAVVEGREQPLVSGEDGTRTLAATLAVHESARTCAPVDLARDYAAIAAAAG